MKTLALAMLALVLLPRLSGLAGTPDPKSPKIPVLPPAEAWGYPLLGGGVKSSDVYVDGHLFLTAPVWSTIGLDGTLGGDYLFIEPYTSWGEQGEVATSVGLGWRHLFSDQSVSALRSGSGTGLMGEGWYLGASLFVDMLDTQFGNQFWQLGVGAEIGTRYLELRGNYYIPLSDRKLAAESVSERAFTTSRTSYRQSGAGYGDPYATQHQIAQDVDLTTSAITTYRTTKVRTVTRLFEEGMEGWDAEVAVLLPWVDQWCDVSLLAGYFSFDNQPFGPQTGGTGNVEGWKAGIEARPVPAIVLSAMWYEDERFTGSDWTVGVGFEIPLDRTWRDAFKPRRRHLVERLAEPVRRQNVAVKIGNSEEEKTTTTTNVRRVTRVVSQTQQRVVLADDIVFVNDGPAVGNGIQQGNAEGDGTAEHPVDTMQTGAMLAGNNSTTTGRLWTTYVQARPAGGAYNGTVEVVGDTRFLGSGIPIAGQGGRNFGGTGPDPRLVGGIVANDAVPASSFTHDISTLIVQGFQIEGGSDPSFPVTLAQGTGVFATGVENVAITDNEFVGTTGSASIFLRGNPASSAADAAGDFTFEISRNHIHDPVLDNFGLGSEGVTITGNRGARVNAVIADNLLENTGRGGINLSSSNSVAGSGITAAITGNTILSPHGSGIVSSSRTSPSVPVFINTTISGNVIIAPWTDGILISNPTLIFGASTFLSQTTTITGNTIQDAGRHGLELYATTESSIAATIADNIFHNAGQDYIHTESHGSSTLNAAINGNVFNSALFSAINAQASESSTTGLTVIGNTLLASDNSWGIALWAFDGARAGLVIGGNDITLGADGVGIFLNHNSSSPFTVAPGGTPADNLITKPAGSGFLLQTSGANAPAITGSLLINGATISPPVTVP